jgi:hypothetical protein
MEQSKPRNWWSRNWKWFVPVGCLSSLLLLAGFFAAILMLVFGLIKSSDAYQQAVLKARSSPAAIQALGSPIKEGYFTTGSVNVSGDSGHAALAIRLSGPNGTGTLHVDADKSAGVWSFSTLAVEVDGTHKRIDLLDDRAKP